MHTVHCEPYKAPRTYDTCIIFIASCGNVPSAVAYKIRNPWKLFYVITTAGHGFQKSPIVGKMLSELALDLPPSYDVSLFRLDRFNKQKSKL